MDYRLILVEGLPGMGKTTLSEKIYKLLSEQGIKTELLLEGNARIPSNFCNIAGVPKGDFTDCIEESIIAIKKTDNYIFVNLSGCSEETAKQLQRYDVGDEFNKFISAQEYSRCTLEWWQNWASNISLDTVLILDSAFMQCPINEMIFRKASNIEVEAYIRAIAEIIKSLNPVCIYLRRENAEIAINFAKAVKGEHWTKGIEGLKDFGCPDLFERRFALENILLSMLPNIVCDIANFDWSDADFKIHKLFYG